MLSNQGYKFRAKITLYSGKMGGRAKPIYSGYRPSFVFNSKKHYSGEIHLLEKDELKPGETSRVRVRLLPAQTIRTLKPNDAFTISEGNKTVGAGVIESVEVKNYSA
jgi:translation elongation factor EF-Tu-like GTPase